jgi:hypothetical protein
MATNNSITYFLREAKFRGNDAGRKYYAQAHPLRAFDTEDLVAYMAGKNTTFTRFDIRGVLDLLAESVGEILGRGYAVRTDVFNAQLAVRGTFASIDDSFDKKRHELRATLSPGTRLAKRIAGFDRPAKVRRPVRVPQVYSVYDFISQSTDGTLTAGRSAEIRGADLVSYPDRVSSSVADEQGIFFVDVRTEQRIARADVVRQSPSTIIVNVPELPAAGEYAMVVVRAFGSELREGRFRVTVRIAAPPSARERNVAPSLPPRSVPAVRESGDRSPVRPLSVPGTEAPLGRSANPSAAFPESEARRGRVPDDGGSPRNREGP